MRFVVAIVLSLAISQVAQASNLRARVVMAIDRVENKIQSTKWNFNTLEDKRKLERDLALLRRLYDRIVDHESDLVTLGCAGATIDLDDGPPRSTESSDETGTLSLGARQLPRAPPGAGGPGGSDSAGPTAIGPLGFHFVFAREVTDTEVQLLAEIVYIDDLLDNKDWHFNNLSEQRELRERRKQAMSALRRIRNSRC